MKEKKKMPNLSQAQWEALVYSKDISREPGSTPPIYNAFTAQELFVREEASNENRSLSQIEGDLEKLKDKGFIEIVYRVTPAGAAHQQ